MNDMLGKTLRARRTEAGLTLRFAADEMGVTMARLSAIEQGKEDISDQEREWFEWAIQRAKQRIRT